MCMDEHHITEMYFIMSPMNSAEGTYRVCIGCWFTMVSAIRKAVG